ncbi:MAG: hypothetical protein M1816_004552 [Peltula sp. TS41687]|nr:MAG: hypothetical protein M1816_004552 [Peltula sp. TS41687]
MRFLKLTLIASCFLSSSSWALPQQERPKYDPYMQHNDDGSARLSPSDSPSNNNPWHLSVQQLAAIIGIPTAAYAGKRLGFPMVQNAVKGLKWKVAKTLVERSGPNGRTRIREALVKSWQEGWGWTEEFARCVAVSALPTLHIPETDASLKLIPEVGRLPDNEESSRQQYQDECREQYPNGDDTPELRETVRQEMIETGMGPELGWSRDFSVCMAQHMVPAKGVYSVKVSDLTWDLWWADCRLKHPGGDGSSRRRSAGDSSSDQNNNNDVAVKNPAGGGANQRKFDLVGKGMTRFAQQEIPAALQRAKKEVGSFLSRVSAAGGAGKSPTSAAPPEWIPATSPMLPGRISLK